MRRLLIVLALVAPALVPAVARANETLRTYEVRQASVSERFDFSGDPAAGCAARGVCGLSGTLTVTAQQPTTPGPVGFATFFTSSRGVSGDLDVFRAPATFAATVKIAGVTTSCTASRPLAELSAAAIGLRRPRIVLHARLAADDAAGPTRTVCGGPRLADLVHAGAVPMASTSRAELSGRRLGLTLRVARTVLTPGFRVHATGRATFTLVRQEERTIHTQSGHESLPPVTVLRVRSARVREQLRFAGTSTAGCARAGVCGVSGTSRYRLDARRGMLLLTSSNDRPDFAFGELVGTGATNADVTTTGASEACHDVVGHRDDVLVAMPFRGRLLFAPEEDGMLDRLGTRCPGPDNVLFGGGMRAVVRPGPLVHAPLGATVTVRWTGVRSFRRAGFDGALATRVEMRLRRVACRTPEACLRLFSRTSGAGGEILTIR